jgi:hypothetical protein
LFVPKKPNHSKKYKFYPISRNFLKSFNSNKIYESDNLYFNSLINNNSQIKNLKLRPLFKRTIYNSEHKKRSSENQKSKIGYNNYFKNKSIQSDLEDEIENRNNNSKKKNAINFILNKKLKTYRAKKIKEVSINSSNNLDSLYGKGMFEKHFERNYMIRAKPLKYYFENNNKTPRSLDKKSNILSFFDKDENLSHNKKIFETIDLGDKKEVFAFKLLNEDNDRNQDNNLDCHSLMKYPSNPYNITTNNNYSTKFIGFSPSLRSKLKAINFKSKNSNKPNFHDLKS